MSAEGSQQRKVLQPTSSQSNSYLYLSFTNKIYSVGDLLTVNYNTIKAQERGFIYYMVSEHNMVCFDKEKQELYISSTSNLTMF